MGRLDPTGTHVWSRQIVAEGFAVLTLWHLGIDSAGNLLLSGTLKGKLIVDGTTLDSPARQTPYVMAMAADGKLAWARMFPSSVEAQTVQLASLGDGSLVWTVGAGTIDFGAGPQGKEGINAGHLARLDAKGSTLWSRVIGQGGIDSLVVAPSPQGGYAIGGAFRDKLDLGDGEHTSAGKTDIFLAGLDPQGGTQWSIRVGDAWDQSVDGLRVDESGDLLVRSSALKSDGPGSGSVVLSRWRMQ
jgi:hypothetical protein